METEEPKTKTSINSTYKCGGSYIRQRQKANARKRKYLDNLTEEQRELKRAKDREYYQKQKAAKKTKFINDMTEREKRQQRAQWKKNSKIYRQKKKNSINIVNNTLPLSGEENMNNETPRSINGKNKGRKAVTKDGNKAYRIIAIQNAIIQQMQTEIDSLKEKLNDKKGKKEI